MKEITDFFIQNGISEVGFYLLLALPIITTIIGFGRYFIGIRAIGLFTPISITYAFYLFGLHGRFEDRSDLIFGLRVGITLCLIIFSIATLIHLMTKKIRLHYLPKVGIVITSITFFLLVILYGLSKLGIMKLTLIDPIGLILLVISIEQYIEVFIKKSFSSATLLGFETILVSSISYSLLVIPSLQKFLLSYPLLILLAIPINVIIGRFTGLRLREYFRFRDILNQDGTNNDSQE